MANTPAYYINSVSTNVCGQTLVPNDIVFVYWNLAGSPTYDSCFVSIRPISNLHDNNAFVAQVSPHPQRAGSSTNIIIPRQPANSAFPFNGSEFIVRVNTGDGIYADSCTFRIQESYHAPWPWSEYTSIISIVFTVVLGVTSILIAIWSAKKSARTKRELDELTIVEAEKEAIPATEHTDRGMGITGPPTKRSQFIVTQDMV